MYFTTDMSERMNGKGVPPPLPFLRVLIMIWGILTVLSNQKNAYIKIYVYT